MRRSALTLVLLTLAACSHAQAPADTPTPEASLHPALAPLAGLIGDWEGQARAMTPTGPKEMIQTERVRPELGGAILIVEGTGREIGEDGEPGAVVFNAFGIFSVDTATGTVYLDAFTQEGRHVRVAPTLLDDGFDWGLQPDLGPTIEYQMRFDEDGRWVETGRASMDGGATWFDSFSMTLTRME
ncbi:MAG: hypothetical protein AAFQ43_15360 [Bacteroidota bacterium]